MLKQGKLYIIGHTDTSPPNGSWIWKNIPSTVGHHTSLQAGFFSLNIWFICINIRSLSGVVLNTNTTDRLIADFEFVQFEIYYRLFVCPKMHSWIRIHLRKINACIITGSVADPGSGMEKNPDPGSW
jgi:hypothetical protein